MGEEADYDDYDDYDDDAEGPSCYRVLNPVARKQHTCIECEGIIERHELYVKTTGIWDGKAYTFKQCADCVELIKDIGFRGAYGSLRNITYNRVHGARYLEIKRKRGAQLSKFELAQAQYYTTTP